MFIWDFVADTVLGQIVDWIYSQVVGFLGVFFSLMGNMGAELVEMSWVQSIIVFFSYLAWALFATGGVVGGFEYAIESQSGRGGLHPDPGDGRAERSAPCGDHPPGYQSGQHIYHQ